MTIRLPIALAPGERAIVARRVSKRYGPVTALDAIELEVPTGAFYLLVGPNGAGKSTIMKLILDLARPTVGHVEVFGLDLGTQSARIRANIGYVPERPDWAYSWMTVGRALAHHARYFENWDASYAANLARAFSIKPERRMGTLSKGQARRVHLVMALAHRPSLLLLDEPTDGLDPVLRDEVLSVLAAHLADTQTTVLISTHHAMEVERLADHVGVMRQGTLRAQLHLDDLRAQLRRYRIQVVGPWEEPPALSALVLRRSPPGREVEWTVWGPESEIVSHLERAGATVNAVQTMRLEESLVALLRDGESRP